MTRDQSTWFLLTMLLCTSCAHKFDGVRQTEWYRSREASILKTKAQYDEERRRFPTIGFHHEAIWVGQVATVSTNELENTGVTKPIALSSVRQLVGSIPLRDSEVEVSFSSPKDFPEGLPKVGETWAFAVGANSKMFWHVWSGLHIIDAKGN